MLNDLPDYARSTVEKYSIPAVSLAVWQGGELSRAATGVLNRNTGVEATVDSIFQIGSITKVMTTCLVMQLVDEGLVDLDTPVRHYLRDFMIADPCATESITVRQLLNHTSGIAGDYFPDDHGQEGNLIARYVDRCSLLPLVHPVGEGFSYSNTAFAVAGRLVEVMRRMPWQEAMQRHIFRPLGMTRAIADPADVIYHRVAMGHVNTGEKAGEKANGDSLWQVADDAYLTLGQAPAGTTPTMTAADLITFARVFMGGANTPSGDRFLSPEAMAAMQTSHWEHMSLSRISRRHQGLGWMVSEYEASGQRAIQHGGATNGFLSNLVVFPEQNAAFAVLLNSFDASALQGITKDLFKAVADLDLEEPEPAGNTDATFLHPFVGHYESFDTAIDVEMRGSRLLMTIEYKIDPMPPVTLELRHDRDGCFAAFTGEGERRANILFQERDIDGVPRYLFNGLRLNTRRGAQGAIS